MGPPDFSQFGEPVGGVDPAPQGFDILPPEGTVSTPLEQPTLNPDLRGRRVAPDMGAVERAVFPPVVRRAADAGVLFDKPAPKGQFLSSLAFDEKNARRALERELGTSVRVGPQTGVLEYFDKETNRYALVSPPGALDLVPGGGAIQFVPEAAGGAVAGFFTKSPVATEVSAGFGAGLGEVIRLKLGQKLGINEDVSDADIVKAGLKSAGIAAASGVVVNKFVKSAKFIVDIAAGRTFTRRSLEQMDLSIHEAQAVADKVNDVLGAERFRLSLAQATNDENLLDLQDFYKRSREFGPQFGAFSDAQQGALKEFYEKISTPYRSRATTAETGQRVIDLAEDQIDSAVRRQDVLVDQAEAELHSALSSMSGRPSVSVGSVLRDTGSVGQQGFRDWADEAAAALNKLAGGKEFIPNKATHAAVTKLDSEVTEALFPSLERSKRTLIGEAPSPEDADLQKVVAKIYDPNARFTFSQTWRAISALRRAASISSKGLSTETPEVGALNMLANALEKDMTDGMRGSPLREQFENFIGRYRAEKLRLDNGVVKDIMRREGGRNGRFVVADENVFRTVFRPNGIREAKELRALIENDPQAMTAMRESIVDFYKGEVLDAGRVRLSSHKQFLRDYIGPLREFFSKEEINAFIAPGRIEKVLQAREAARKEAVQQINKTFDARLANLDNPGAVFNTIFDPNNPQKLRKAVQLLERTPDVLRGVRYEFRKRMAERVAGEFRNGERFFSPAKLSDFLDGKSGEAGHAGVVKELFGEQYLKDLRTLSDAMTITSREARFPNRSNTAFWNDTVKGLARAYVGLFTRPGRVITALDRIRGRAANRVLAHAMMNPGDLNKLISLTGVDMRSQQAIALLGSLGGSALFEDFE